MFTAKKDVKFKQVSLLQFMRMFIGNADGKQNGIKTLCVDEANKEYFVITVFLGNKDFDLRGYAYLNNYSDCFWNPDREWCVEDFNKLKSTFILKIADTIQVEKSEVYISDSTDKHCKFGVNPFNKMIRLTNFMMVKSWSELWCIHFIFWS